jgi:hypothetical protein
MSKPSSYSGSQLLYPEGTMSNGFFLKKKPPCTPPDSARELGNRSKGQELEAEGSPSCGDV